MIFEIPFNEEIYKKQTSLHLNLHWNKILKKNKSNLLIAIVFFLLGVLAIYGNGDVGYVFVIFGIYGFIEFYRIHTAYQKSKKEFHKMIDNEIKGQIESNENSIWEFNEEYFRYKDYKCDTKINWKTFKSFRIIDDNLFLDLNMGIQSSYIMAKEEIGENSFQKATAFLDGKIERI